ncbi:hypothetical protein [Streptomyces wuyuanensis]|uniref:hypothetical protein n=1 Tax=Streptomyces wuyuanensis TaxID=1196353 RepID=UPI00115FDA9E|nr:hypothetical protein [Streptomyces wuyuanensis]
MTPARPVCRSCTELCVRRYGSDTSSAEWARVLRDLATVPGWPAAGAGVPGCCHGQITDVLSHLVDNGIKHAMATAPHS